MATREYAAQVGGPRPAVRRWCLVAVATALVAGCPVVAVWWLRESAIVTSMPLALGLGMALSLLASSLGRVLWERQPGSEDLLFNELMVWGYVHRLRKQRRLASVADLVEERGESRSSREQRRLLERMVSAMETRDPYLHGHSRRVARHSWMIAQRLKLPRDEVARIRRAAALHDVGKTKTPKAILHNPGRLTDEEYRIIKLHPGEGGAMVSVLHDEQLVGIIRHHHERLDGSGYPDGLAGPAIPLGARIIAVADTFDAITSARAYRSASPHKRAIDILHEESGLRLDPDVVKAFCANYAGRGPLALWSFVCGLPERIVTWLSSSVGAVATAAKVVAVAAVVGGAAATSATLGLSAAPAKAGHGHPSAAAAAASATHTAPPRSAILNAPSRAGAVTPGGRHSGTAAPHHTAAAVHAAAPQGVASPPGEATRAATGAYIPAAATAERKSPPGVGSSGEEHGSGGAEKTSGKSERPTSSKGEEAKAKKEEAAPKASEETHGASGEEHGNSGESPGYVKKEEAATPPSEHAPASSGGPESGSHGKGAGSEAGKSGEAHEKGQG